MTNIFGPGAVIIYNLGLNVYFVESISWIVSSSGLRTCRRSRPCIGLCTEVRTSFFTILKHKTKKPILGLQASVSKCLLHSSGSTF